MTDEQTLDGVVSERDARLRERAAFVEGAKWEYTRLRIPQSPLGPPSENAARERYPIRKKVPREFVTKDKDGDPLRVRVVDGSFQVLRAYESEWVSQFATLTPANVRAFADLLDNPYEERDE